jgi:hypothetical protein
MLEWLMMAVPQQELKQNWVRFGVFRVAQDLTNFSNQEIDPGPLYHAVHAITLYRERVTPKQIKPQDPKPMESLARQPAATPPAGRSPEPKVAPPQPTIEPKAIATTPANPQSPRPVQEPAPEKKVAMAPPDPATKPSPLPEPNREQKPEQKPTAPAVAVDPPKPIPTNNDAAPVPMPEPGTPPTAPIASPARAKDPAIALPTLPAPSSIADAKRPPAIPFKEPVGTSATPPSPTPVEPPAVPEQKPLVLPDVQLGGLPTPPTFEMIKNPVRATKPADADTAAPKPTRVTGPTPIVLPPLPLDPVDQAAATAATPTN